MLALFSGSSFPFDQEQGLFDAHLPRDYQEEEEEEEEEDDEEEEEEEEEEDEEETDSDDDDDEEEEEEADSDDDAEHDQDSDDEVEGGGGCELRLPPLPFSFPPDEEEDAIDDGGIDDGGIVFGPAPPTAAQLHADRLLRVQDGNGNAELTASLQLIAASLTSRPEGTGGGRQPKRPRTATPSASASLESSKGKDVPDEPADTKKVCLCA
jgi:hypothetical protein